VRDTGPANETKTVGPEAAARSKLDMSSRVPVTTKTFAFLVISSGSFDGVRTYRVKVCPWLNAV
jgi:hypothetical protein